MERRTQYEAAVIIILVTATGLIISAQQQRYRQLSEENSGVLTELMETQMLLAEAEASLDQYNITLTMLETDPVVKAANMIISQVGLEYFTQYFHSPTFQIFELDHNISLVEYTYTLQVEDYTSDQTVFFSFHHGHVMSYGIPLPENQLPFNITQQEAIALAIEAGLPDGPYPLEANIQYSGGSDVRPLKGDEEKYVWTVGSWLDPPWANPREGQYLNIDPNTGEIYRKLNGISTVSEAEVDTIEKAHQVGVESYVKLHYSELPQRIILADSENITFTIQASLISYTDSIDSVTLTVDPQNYDTYWIDSNLGNNLRDILVYEPSGVFELRAGEPLNFTCTLTVPSSETELAFSRYTLHCLGIGAENTLIVHDLST